MGMNRINAAPETIGPKKPAGNLVTEADIRAGPPGIVSKHIGFALSIGPLVLAGIKNPRGVYDAGGG
jgi:hypothetical protein